LLACRHSKDNGPEGMKKAAFAPALGRHTALLLFALLELLQASKKEGGQKEKYIFLIKQGSLWGSKG